jgi:hypothetical protein
MIICVDTKAMRRNEPCIELWYEGLDEPHVHKEVILRGEITVVAGESPISKSGAKVVIKCEDDDVEVVR